VTASTETGSAPSAGDPIESDVLVVGGGPGGSSVAVRLARKGHSVVLVEKRPTPRLKACGDTLTPRSIAELAEVGLDVDSLRGHPILGVEMRHRRATTQTPWPDHPDFPAVGVAIRRDLLDERLRCTASEHGAVVLAGHEATSPIIERGFVRGANLQRADGSSSAARARFVVVADGANSRFGRVVGTSRDHRWPYAVSTRTYFQSERSDHRWIEATLGLTDVDHSSIAGYGWVVPLGDGTVNVGIGLLSTSRDVKRLNALKLLGDFSESVADRWRFDPQAAQKAPTRFRIPLGGSVTPKMGPTFLLVGDAAGVANPFSGVGIDAALMSGRLAATALDDALVTGSAAGLQRYPTLLEEEIGRYYKVGRLTARFLGRPSVLNPLLRVGARSEKLTAGMLRLAGNELRSIDPGGAERAYAIAAALSKLAPSW
jgi:geranylgeranyl reductase family protein